MRRSSAIPWRRNRYGSCPAGASRSCRRWTTARDRGSPPRTCCSPRSAPMSLRPVDPWTLSALPKLGQYLRGIELDHLLLVGLPRVDVDDGRAAVEQLVDGIDM